MSHLKSYKTDIKGLKAYWNSVYGLEYSR